ncbi:hypothetical protein AY599_00745 [Leptolyngbya valderiana BDU 20041]|nr:hypothetical protein AY599_00745 [Leptolyngbya valderiana BDU 20041]
MRHLRLLWDALRSSLWFVPSLFVLGAILLAQGMIELDHLLPIERFEEALPRLFAVGPSGARSLLATIAGSMISVAGVAFSITIVALTLASSQYTSRILRNFMRDRANQAVLGAFVGIFVYCLWVLRTISEGDDYSFVPIFAILAAVLLALVGIACLIFFIHHIAQAIQAEHIILAATSETLAAVDRLFPERVAQPAEAVRPPLPADDTTWRSIAAPKTGYLQSVDGDGLVKHASDRGCVVRMECPVGHFIVEGSPLVSLGNAAEPDDETRKTINGYFVIGGQRTIVQDASYGIRQIVDMAIKALSPGINDTTTAVSCTEHLTAIMAKIAGRKMPSKYRAENGQVRFIAIRPDFETLLGNAFDQIRQNAGGNVATLRALVEGLAVVADRTDEPDRISAIRRQLDLFARKAEATIEQLEDRRDIDAAVEALRRRLAISADP